ncbi:uncharacterized protein [Hetaerina americana]|uniref:uncharacterized protein isoform X2 n=1 Tax=Hetaerina americana TaxID=62018 RepID=UPI003A7F172E
MELMDQEVRRKRDPVNFFQRVLMQTRKPPNSKEGDKSTEKRGSVAEGHSSKHVNGSGEANDGGRVRGYTEEIIDLVVHGKCSVREKVLTLKVLIEYCSENPKFVETDSFKSLISYCEKLLVAYCNSRTTVAEDSGLLVPLLFLLLTYTNHVETKVFEASLVRQSDLMYQLMRSCVMCVDALLSKSEELMRVAWKKKLAGRVSKLAKEDSVLKVTRLIGNPSISTHESDIPQENVPVESYQVNLFDTSSGVTDKDINQHIINMQFPKLSTFSVDLPGISSFGSGSKKELDGDERVWTDVVVANVLPHGEFLAYTNGDWSHWLNHINGELVEFLRTINLKNEERDQDLEIKIGSIVGFWSAEMKFNWKPLMMMQCFRGIVLGKAVNGLLEGGSNVSWAIWAMDIGTLVFGKAVWLLGPHLCSIPPLVSICSLELEGGASEGDSLFLFVALKLLAKLLATNPSAGRHMVAFGSRKFENACDSFDENGKSCDGGVVLKLIVHPDIEIRVEFLKLIILLARSSSEVLRYLMECRFYLAIYSRLEICVHLCNMWPSNCPTWSEVRLLVMLLSTMAEGTEMNMSELPGFNRIQQVLIMLTEIDNHAYVRFMAAKCLASFENHKVMKSTTNRGAMQGSSKQRPHQIYAAEKSNVDAGFPKTENQRPSRSGNSHKSNFKTVNPAHFTEKGKESQECFLSVLGEGDDSSSDEESSSLPPVDALEDMARQVDRYTKGYRVGICNDMTHELSQEKFSNQISENILSQVLIV